MSVYDYLQKIRMERALELLQQGDLSITEVAVSVGMRTQQLLDCLPHAVRLCTSRLRNGLI